jgi:hypothetical protein
MLNLITFDGNNRNLLQGSYDAIKNKDRLEIIIEETEKQQIFQQIISAIKIPFDATFSFQNLFKLNLPGGHFYIAQCLFDFGYPLGTKGGRSNTHRYNLQVIGIANCTIDLGITYIRPETGLDKFTGRFFDKDIDLPNTEKFNDKYYMASDRPEFIRSIFNQSFVNCIGKYDDILLTTKNNEMFISFANDLANQQCRILEDIFSNCNFLGK